MWVFNSLITKLERTFKKQIPLGGVIRWFEFTRDSCKRKDWVGRAKKAGQGPCRQTSLARQFCPWPALFMSVFTTILQAIELHYPFHSNNMNRIQMWYLMMSCLLNDFRTAWHAAANYCQLEGRRASTKVPIFLWKIPVIYSLCLKNEFLFHWLNL